MFTLVTAGFVRTHNTRPYGFLHTCLCTYLNLSSLRFYHTLAVAFISFHFVVVVVAGRFVNEDENNPECESNFYQQKNVMCENIDENMFGTRQQQKIVVYRVSVHFSFLFHFPK